MAFVVENTAHRHPMSEPSTGYSLLTCCEMGGADSSGIVALGFLDGEVGWRCSGMDFIH
jgi:hypothetical protein